MSQSRLSHYDSAQRGVALITILIMVALVTILAASIAKQQQYTADATQAFLSQNQALLYAESAESFFAELLLDDAKNAGGVDHLNENWAKPMPTYPVDDGFVTGQIIDENARFNVNNLLNEQGEVDEAAKTAFMNILQYVNLPEQQVESVIDWIDGDDETIGAMGAEQNYYRGIAGGYLPTNKPMYQIEELKLVRGFEGENFYRIQPYLTALPTGTKLNVNTASALVLAAMIPNSDVLVLQSNLKLKRDNAEHFNQVGDVFTLEALQHIPEELKTKLSGLFDIRSDYYTADIQVQLGQRVRKLRTQFVRQDDQQVYVVARQLVMSSESMQGKTIQAQ